MLTAEQVKERVNYIGGSDAAAILGLSRWNTPLSVWANKTGQIEQEDVSNKLAIEVGNELESLVCKLFTKRTGKETRRENRTIVHPNYPFIRANIDRAIVGEDAIFEAKTCSAWKAKEWDGQEIPQEYIIQCMHYLAVTGKARCYIAVLIGGNMDFRWRVVERDPMLIGEMMKKEAEFWVKYIEPKIMPMNVSKHDSGVLLKLFPHGTESENPIELDEEANRILDTLEGYKADLKGLEGLIDKEQNALKIRLGLNSEAITDRWKITWRNQETNRIDSAKLKDEMPEVYTKMLKATNSRVLRITKKREE